MPPPLTIKNEGAVAEKSFFKGIFDIQKFYLIAF